MAAPQQIDRTLDARGTFCPIPVVEAARALREMRPGEVLLVLATDPGVVTDFPDWCKASRHPLLQLLRGDRLYRIFIQRGSLPGKAMAPPGEAIDRSAP